MAPSLAPTTGRSGGLANLKASQASAAPSALDDAPAASLTAANSNFQLSNLTGNAGGLLPAAANDDLPANVVLFPRSGNNISTTHTAADFTDPDMDLGKAEYFDKGYDESLQRYFSQKPPYVDDWEEPEAANDDMLMGDAVLLDDDDDLKRRRHHRPRIRKSRAEEEREEREEREREKAEKEKAEKERKPGEQGDEKPHAETHGQGEKGLPERGVRDVEAPRITEGAGRDFIGGEDAARDMGSLGKLSSTIAETGAAARTAWEGSRLLRIGGLVAGGLVVGTVGGILGAAVVVALVSGAVVYGVTRNQDKTLKAMLHMGREAIVPDDALVAFKQGQIFHGLDLTLGISSFVHLAKTVVKGGAHLAGDFIKNPQAAIHEVTTAAEKTAKGVGTAVDLGVTLFADHKTSGAAAQTASDALTGENTGGARNLFTAVRGNHDLSAKLAKLMGSGLNATPQLAMTGGRRPAAANDELGLAYNGAVPDHPQFTPDSHLHELNA